MAEQWRDVVGFEGQYQVSDVGRLRNVRSGRHLKGSPNGGGYVIVQLTPERGKCRALYLHRLVCAAFQGPPRSPDLVVNHLNGIKLDCRAGNLAWCTRAENNAHAAKLGLLPDRRGSRNSQAKLTEREVVEMRRRSRSGTSYSQLAKDYAVSVPTAYEAVIGRTWKHVRDGLYAPSAVSES